MRECKNVVGSSKRVGILALQGDFSKHKEKFDSLESNTKTILVKKEEQLSAIDALVIPGGESTTLLKLLSDSFKDKIVKFANAGNFIFGTCAGCILLAKNVTNPEQESLGLINIKVQRNAYGRQNDSFIAKNIQFKNETLKEAVFIRAPKITEIGDNVEVFAKIDDTPILVRQNNILLATYHPELSLDTTLYKYMTKFLLC